MTAPLLELRDIHVSYLVRGGGIQRRRQTQVAAVRGVSLTLEAGDSLAIVGESGSGKTSLARVIVRLVKPSSGVVLLDGKELSTWRSGDEMGFRRRVQMVFQNPYDSLDPKMSVGRIVGEGMVIHNLATGRKLESLVKDALAAVHLPERVYRMYPRELSGGQRQRVAIARALVLEPEILVLDEPLSSLDVSVQAQIIRLLNELREDSRLTYLFVSHDLAAVPDVCERVAVMYLGQIMEVGDALSVIQRPTHPYTQALVSAAPIPDPDIERRRERVVLRGELPSVSDPPSGCPFRTRCPVAHELCAERQPPIRAIESGWNVACHLVSHDGNRIVAPDITTPPPPA